MSSSIPDVPDDLTAAGWRLASNDPARSPDTETLEETTGLISVEMVRDVDGEVEVNVGSGETYEEAMRNATGMHR